MSRLLCFVAAMGLAAAAHAETFSFTVGGHHISISATRNCYRADCVSVSIPGLVASRRKRSDDVATAQDAATLQPRPQAPAPAALPPVVAPAPAPQIAPAAPPVETRAALPPPVLPPSPPPSAPKLAATDTTNVAAPPSSPPAAEPVAQTQPVGPPHAVVHPAPDPAPVLKVAKLVDAARDDSPLGDWQTEGKTGAVRIEACGKALCGYLINPSSQAKAETILINMKPKSEVEWRGSIFSRASGNTYNATMTLSGANLLRVEACALGHFFCSRNDWTRVVKEPAALVTSRDDASAPRS